MKKRFEAGPDQHNINPDEWYVFDNESFSCHAGPMSESAALHLAINLNNQEDEKARAKAPVIGDTPESMSIGMMINGKVYTAAIILKMEADLQELGSVDAGYEAGFKRGYWWGFENSRCSSGQSNILASYTDVMGLRQRNAAHIAHLKGIQNCATQKN